MMPIVAVTRLHVMMIVVDRALADHIPIIVRVKLAVMMIVMDDVGVPIAIHLCHAILVLVSARGSRGQKKRSGCQSTKECLFHGRFGEGRRWVIR